MEPITALFSKYDMHVVAETNGIDIGEFLCSAKPLWYLQSQTAGQSGFHLKNLDEAL